MRIFENKTDVKIRPFEDRDESTVIALWRACGLARLWNDPAKDIARKRTVQPEAFLVAVFAEQVIGSVMAGYDGHRGWINYLAVASAFRRKGVGRSLMDEAQAKLLGMGCPKINLQVRSTNDQVVAFYQSLGYEVDDVVSLGKRIEDDTPA